MVDVTDMVQPKLQPTLRAETVRATEEIKDELGDERTRIEVWGLTGWYLSLLLKILQVYR